MSGRAGSAVETGEVHAGTLKGLWTWDMVAAPVSRGTFANLGVRAQML